MNIVEDAIRVTLKTINTESGMWLNPEKGILSRFVNEGQSLKRRITLREEIPIFEYSEEGCYSLITSQRVISERKKEGYNEKDLINISVVRPLFTNDPFDDPGPIKILRVIDDNKQEMLIEFDSGKPTYFACMLIINLKSKLRDGHWFR